MPEGYTSPIHSLLYGGSTRLGMGQIGTANLFNIPDALHNRGFIVKEEEGWKATLLGKHKGLILEDANNTKNAVEFLKKFNEKEFRNKVREQVSGKSEDWLSVSDLDIFFEANGDNEQRFSKTVELLTAYQCIKDLRALSASFGVKIKSAPYGGDYDCIANFQHHIVNFEIKSGSVWNISQDSIKSFLERHSYLCPELSILLLDYDGLEDVFIIDKFFGVEVDEFNRVDKITKFTVDGKAIYVLNSTIVIVQISNSGDILSHMRAALKYYFRYRNWQLRSDYRLMRPEYLGISGEILKDYQ